MSVMGEILLNKFNTLYKTVCPSLDLMRGMPLFLLTPSHVCDLCYTKAAAHEPVKNLIMLAALGESFMGTCI